jgi:hypothetical protein
LGFAFEDFAVYMRARAISHSADTTKALLWRSKRFGPEGNQVRVKYVLPTAPSQALTTTLNTSTSKDAVVSARLPSAAARTGYTVRTTSKVGLAAATTGALRTLTYIFGFTVPAATRLSNVTTLTLTLPAGVTDHGLQIGDTIYLNSSNTGFSASGAKTITARAAGTISYAEVAANAGPVALGTISFDSADVTLAGASIGVGDVMTVAAASTLDANYEQTLRITAFGNQYAQGVVEVFAGLDTATAAWSTLGATSALAFYPLTNNTATALASAVNALGAICPVNATVVGTGLGSIDQATFEENAAVGYTYALTDGVNYVKTTTSPVSLAGDYQLAFKDGITASLATGSDWANEEVRIAPVTTAGLVRWLSCQGVTGLSNACSLAASSQGAKLQIATQTTGSEGSVQVQGGTANSASAAVFGSATVDGSSYSIVTVKETDAHGLLRRHLGLR